MHAQIMANQDTKYESNPTKDKWLVTYTRFRDGRTDGRTRVFQHTHHSASGGIKIFHVCLTIRPSLNLVYVTSHLSFVGVYTQPLSSWSIHLIGWVHINAHCRIKGVFDNLVKFMYKLGKNWQTRAWHPVFKTAGSAPDAAMIHGYFHKKS